LLIPSFCVVHPRSAVAQSYSVTSNAQIDLFNSFGNGRNAETYVLSQLPILGSLVTVFLNGQLMYPVVDYTFSQVGYGAGADIVFNSPPFNTNQPADAVFVEVIYWTAGGSPPSAPAGTVTSVTCGIFGFSWLTCNFNNSTSSPSLVLSATAGQTPHKVIGTCGTLTSFQPCSLVASDIPLLNQSTTGNAATATSATTANYATTSGLAASATVLASYPSLCTGGQFSQGFSLASNNCGTPSGSGGSMTWPSGGAGVPLYNGSSAWGTSYSVGTAALNLVQLNSSAQLPPVSAALLTGYPSLCTGTQFSKGLSTGSNNCGTPTGTGGGATVSSQLTDFTPLYINGTTVTVGANCSSATPCPAAFNLTTYQITTGYTITLSGTGSNCGSYPTQCGTVRFYVDSSGYFNCASDSLSTAYFSCSGGAIKSSGVGNFPYGTLPQGYCTVLSVPSTWDAAGCVSVKSLQRQTVLAAGSGISLTNTPTLTTIAADVYYSQFLVGTSLVDFTGNCNGVFDNTTAFSTAIAAVVASGGGRLVLPYGTCLTGTINLPTTVPFWMQGQGVDATVVKLKSGANADLLTQSNFSSLTGTNSTAGIFRVKLSDMTLDGNNTNQSGTSWVLRTYGHGNYWENLVIQNGLTGGRYSEYALDSSFGTPADDLEDSYNNVKTIFNGVDVSLSTKTFTFSTSGGTNYVHYVTIGSNTYTYTQQAGDTAASITTSLLGLIVDSNATATSPTTTTILLTAAANSGSTVAVSASDSNTSGSLVENQQGDGFLFRGPHDTVLQNIVSYGNTGWGFHNQTSANYNGGAPHFFGLNTYTNTLGGVYNEDGMLCEDCAFTTATGPGHLISASAGAVDIRNGTWASLSTTAAGLECRNANNNFQGSVVNTVGDGVYLNGCQLSRFDFNFFQVNGPIWRVKSSSTDNMIIASGESTSSTVLFDPLGLQAFPATNCVQMNIQGPAGSLFTKYFLPCVNTALQVDNVNQWIGINVVPQYPLDIQPPQPSAWTVAFSSTGSPPNTWTTGYIHSITVGGTVYSYTQQVSDTGSIIAAALLALVNAGPDPNVTATENGVFITLTAKLNTGALVIVSASDLNGSTTLVENDASFTTPLRIANPAQNAAWLFEQEGGINYLLSSASNLTSGAEVEVAGPSSTALPQFYLFSHNTFFGNQDATGVSGVTIQGATSQGTTPLFTVQTRAPSQLFQIGYDGTVSMLAANATAITASSTITSNGNVYAGNGLTTTGGLHLGCGASAAYDCVLNGSTSSTGNITWNLPAADGTAGQVMGTNGSGVLGFETLLASQVTNAFNNISATTQTVYNSTGSGNTQVIFKDSSSQSGAGAAQLLLQNNAGTNCTFIGTTAASGSAFGDCTNYKQFLTGPTIDVSDDTVINWGNTNSAFGGGLNVGIAWKVSGVLKITNGSSGMGSLGVFALATIAVATSTLPTCTATTGTPWRASVNDALTPAIGVALTGGGAVFANVHCSLTTGTYIVDGL
jgi:hypothetical protein